VYAVRTPKEKTPTAALGAAKRGRNAGENRPIEPEFTVFSSEGGLDLVTTRQGAI